MGEFLASELPSHAVILGGYRQTVGGENPAIGALLDKVQGVPGLKQLVVEPLAEVEVAELIGTVVDAADDTLRQIVALVHAETGGNPAAVSGIIDRLSGVGVLADRLGPADVTRVHEVVALACPYKGLLSFEAEDHARFFGRESFIATATERLAHEGFCAVVGPSGSGKSSVVRAGVLPALRARATGWSSITITPGADPLGALAAALAERSGSDATPSQWKDRLETDPQTMVTAVADTETPRLVVFVDQFEECFTLCGDAGRRGAFFDAVVGAAGRSGSDLALVLAVRGDYFGHCSEHPGLAALLEIGTLLVTPLTPEELRDVIEQPAAAAGLRLEPGLADVMLSDAADQLGGLPLLSHALLETWRRRRARLLTVDAYHEAGGVHGAIARTADAVFERLTDDEQRVARMLLVRLTAIGDGVEPTRRRAPRAELVTAGASGVVVDRVLDTLVDARLVVADDYDVEIAHEALLGQWPRLRQWLDEDRDDLRLLADLERAARGWNNAARPDSDLYRGTRLDAAAELAERSTALTETERAFVGQSVSTRAAERAAERRVNRRLRRLIGVIGVALVVALVAGALAVVQNGRANDRARVATAGRVAAIAADRTDSDLDLALLLAVEARHIDDSITTRSELLRVLTVSPHIARFGQGFGEDVNDGDLSSDGSLGVVGRRDGTIRMFDLQHDSRPRWTRHADSNITAVALSSDRRVVATGSESGALQLWEAQRGRPTDLRLGSHGGSVGIVAFTADGSTLVSAASDNTVKFWSTATGQQTGAVTVAARDIAISPNGALVAIATSGGVLVVQVNDAEATFRLPIDDGVVTAVAFSPDNRRLVAGDDKGRLTVWDLPTHTKVAAQPMGHAQGVLDVAFAPEGTNFASSSLDGSIRLWDLATAAQLGEPLIGQGGLVRKIFYLTGGRLVSGSTEALVTWNAERVLTKRVRTGSAVSLAIFIGAISQDGTRILVNAPDENSLQVFDLASHQPLGPPLNIIPAALVTDATFSRDGRLVAVALNEEPGSDTEPPRGGRVAVWRVPTGKLYQTIRLKPKMAGEPGPGVASVSISADNRSALIGTFEGYVERFNLNNGKRTERLLIDKTHHFAYAKHAPNGRAFVAFGALDRGARLYDLATNRKLESFIGTDQAVGPRELRSRRLSPRADGSKQRGGS